MRFVSECGAGGHGRTLWAPRNCRAGRAIGDRDSPEAVVGQRRPPLAHLGRFLMTKRALIVLLVGVNLVLLATLMLWQWQLPAAQAALTGPAEEYLMVAGEMRDGVDVLYIIDVGRRRMHAFVPNRDLGNRRLFHVGVRDLKRDFRGSP